MTNEYIANEQGELKKTQNHSILLSLIQIKK